MLSLIVSLSLAAAPIKASSKIDEVVVYNASARVTRTARLDLPAGDVQVLFSGLSEQLLDDSLGLSGSGNARARIFGASVERITLPDTPNPEVRAIQDKIAELERQDQALQDTLHAANARRAFVDSMRAVFSQERTQNLPVRASDPREWTSMADFIGRQYDLIGEQQRKTNAARLELAKQLNASRAELAKLQAKRTTASKTVTVDLRVEKAGSFDLGVSYLVQSASWQPVWDARLDAERGLVELSVSGIISQVTGEDWDEVKLSVSTAQPQRPLYVPELQPRYLEKYAYAPVPQRPRRSSRAPSAPSMAEGAPAAAARDDYGGMPEPVYEMERPAAQVSQGLLSASFAAPRRESIDGAGKPRKAFLASFSLKGEISRLVAPAIDQQTYLTAKVQNDSGVPLLPGMVSVFLGEEFLGRTQLPASPFGDELKLAFGADERLKVERKVVERKHETAGVFGGHDLIRYRVRTTVKNLYPTRTTVTVLDQVPVSRDEAIEVKLLEGSTAPTEPADASKPGIRVHKLTLDPKQEKVIELGYEVRFPKGQNIVGLD